MAVPKAMQAVNVSLSVSTMSVFAALLTASTPPQRPAIIGAPALASRLATVRAKRPKPTIMTTVAAAAGIDSLRIDHVSLPDRLLQRMGRNSPPHERRVEHHDREANPRRDERAEPGPRRPHPRRPEVPEDEAPSTE